MQTTKSETNNAIIVRLTNVRAHPNADRLKLATVLGSQVVVGSDAYENQLVVFFDSNLALSSEYLRANDLYSSKEKNQDPSKRGYFGNSGHIRAQRFRGELSTGYVAEIRSLLIPGITWLDEDALKEGVEFSHINGVEICHKYVIVKGAPGTPGNKSKTPIAKHFWRHWETHHLMRQKDDIPEGMIRLEEKVHGTSGRSGYLLCKTGKRWWQFWRPAEEWRVISGTRRVDGIRCHIPDVRTAVHDQIAPHLYKGEQVYYEIFGYDSFGNRIQKLSDYGIPFKQFKVLLYRVTITTPDGHCFDLSRREVDKRAEELCLEKPVVLWEGYYNPVYGTCIEQLLGFADGRSTYDLNTLREGFVLWFQRRDGSWSCLKHKSAEFLAAESALKEEGVGDIEDAL